MITEDYVSFEIAKALKEKGFDEPCQFLYRKTREILSCGTVNLPELTNSQLDKLKTLQVWIDKMFVYTCPTLQMAMKWLREVHNIDIPIAIRFWNKDEDTFVKSWKYTIYRTDEIENFGQSNTYEEACEEAIKYCLKNLI